MSRKLISALTGTATLAAILIGGATPAEAATPRNGVCEAGEVCFYYNSNYAGSVSDFTSSVANYGTDPSTCYTFKGTGAGKGSCIKNQVASVRNRSSQPVTVHYNSNYGGASQTIAAGASANLNATLKNNNASHRFGGSSGTPTPAPSLKNPHAGSLGANGGWTPRAAWLRDQVKARFPGAYCTSYKTTDRTSEHYTGNGLDCWGTPTQRRQIADWAKANARSLEVYYVIYAQKIWSLPRTSEGWRGMADRGNATANHFDHVHISMQNPRNEY